MPEIIKENYFLKNNTYFTVAKTNPMDLVEKEIGDSKVPSEFLPQQKITRWDNECNVSVRLVHDEKNPTVVQEGNKVKWQGEKIEAHFYDVNEGEGASEFEIILKEKPLSNVVQFTLVDKDVDYFFQPELAQEEKDQGAERPKNVIGSYAVYASENKVNYVGGKEYKCGKVGHIFRPKIIDSAGMEVWGELNVDTEQGILSVTIPQVFLDNAVYPVRHAAGLTFGYGTSGGSELDYPTTVLGSLFTSPSNMTNPDSISTYVKFLGGPPSDTLKMCVYSHGADLNAIANSLTSNINVSNTSVHLETFTYSTKPTISASTDYVLMQQATTYGLIGFRYDVGVTNQGHEKGATIGNTLTSPSHNTNKYSIYCTYTAGGGSSIKTVQGLAVASVKTVNGLAIASVKTIQGLA